MQILTWNFYKKIAQFLQISEAFGYLIIEYSCRLWCSVILRTSLYAYPQLMEIITFVQRRHETYEAEQFRS